MGSGRFSSHACIIKILVKCHEEGEILLSALCRAVFLSHCSVPPSGSPTPSPTLTYSQPNSHVCVGGCWTIPVESRGLGTPEKVAEKALQIKADHFPVVLSVVAVRHRSKFSLQDPCSSASRQNSVIREKEKTLTHFLEKVLPYAGFVTTMTAGFLPTIL